MSVTGKGMGIPVCLLQESEGTTITVEAKDGSMYRGLLQEAEDNFNVSLKNVQYTSPEGRVSKLDEVYLRGSQVCFVVLPQVLGKAPMFHRVERFKLEKWVPVGGGSERPMARR